MGAGEPGGFAQLFWSAAPAAGGDAAEAIVSQALGCLEAFDRGEVMNPKTGLPLTLMGLLASLGIEENLVYGSPELARGEIFDERSLVFSIGVLIFERLTDRHPFGTTDQVRLARIRRGELGSGVNYFPSVPHKLRTVLMRAMGPFPEERYGSITEMRVDLIDFAGSAPSRPAAGGGIFAQQTTEVPVGELPAGELPAGELPAGERPSASSTEANDGFGNDESTVVSLAGGNDPLLGAVQFEDVDDLFDEEDGPEYDDDDATHVSAVPPEMARRLSASGMHGAGRSSPRVWGAAAAQRAPAPEPPSSPPSFPREAGKSSPAGPLSLADAWPDSALAARGSGGGDRAGAAGTEGAATTEGAVDAPRAADARRGPDTAAVAGPARPPQPRSCVTSVPAMSGVSSGALLDAGSAEANAAPDPEAAAALQVAVGQDHPRQEGEPEERVTDRIPRVERGVLAAQPGGGRLAAALYIGLGAAAATLFFIVFTLLRSPSIPTRDGKAAIARVEGNKTLGTPKVKGTPPKGTPPKGTPPKGTPPKGTPPKDTPPKGTPKVKGTPPKGTGSRLEGAAGTPPKGTPPKGTPPKGIPKPPKDMLPPSAAAAAGTPLGAGELVAQKARACGAASAGKPMKIAVYARPSGKVVRGFASGPGLTRAQIGCVRKAVRGMILGIELPRAEFVEWRIQLHPDRVGVKVLRPKRLRRASVRKK